MRWHVVSVQRRPKRGAEPLRIEQVFMRDRKSMQRPQSLPARLLLIRLRSGSRSSLRIQGHNRVHLRIDTLNLLQMPGQRFPGRQLLCANQRGHLDCAGEPKRRGRGLGMSRSAWKERTGSNSRQNLATSGLIWHHGADFIIDSATRKWKLIDLPTARPAGRLSDQVTTTSLSAMPPKSFQIRNSSDSAILCRIDQFHSVVWSTIWPS